MQSHGIALSFHREMADSSREFVGPDGSAAVTLESYPRFIKGGFQDYEGLGIKRSTADSKHVPSIRSRLLGTTPFGVFPQKVVEFLELTGTSGDYSKSRPWPNGHRRAKSQSQPALSVQGAASKRPAMTSGKATRLN